MAIETLASSSGCGFVCTNNSSSITLQHQEQQQQTHHQQNQHGTNNHHDTGFAAAKNANKAEDAETAERLGPGRLKPSRLLLLPRELRDQIYDLVFTAPTGELVYEAQSGELRPYKSKTNTNKTDSCSASASVSVSRSDNSDTGASTTSNEAEAEAEAARARGEGNQSRSATFFALRRTNRQLRAETPSQALRCNSIVFDLRPPHPSPSPSQNPLDLDPLDPLPPFTHFLHTLSPHQRSSLRALTLLSPSPLPYISPLLTLFSALALPPLTLHLPVPRSLAHASQAAAFASFVRLAERLLVKAWFVRERRFGVVVELVGEVGGGPMVGGEGGGEAVRNGDGDGDGVGVGEEEEEEVTRRTSVLERLVRGVNAVGCCGAGGAGSREKGDRAGEEEEEEEEEELVVLERAWGVVGLC